MKFIAFLAVLSNVFPALNAHWIFPIVSVNGGPKSLHWQYVRHLGVAPPPYSSPSSPQYGWPHTNLYHEEIRCGRQSFASANKTETLLVDAGDEITFFVTASTSSDEKYVSSYMYHAGAGQSYLSRAENDDLKTYQGDGEWFKITNHGTSDGKTWDIWNKDQVNVTIPKTTPPGKYLLRNEYIAYHQPTLPNSAEFFLSCAHIEVKGPGGGTPEPTVKFPGAYDMFDRSIWRPHSMGYGGTRPGDNYKNPGPDVWMG